ncbi:MAG: SPOR domain-containing protein [Bacteroidales bacterium]|jgi:nucleoid DNA-binding protein/cell division septation protein DedD|nr:SPOR domain-containing protein [Bacteroidales bacterium]MDD4235764.1 SPOR domain-containing protein [Bacteroidales bacterium]MDY0160372.1 SPOR domain-containing protein [Bacteroidales bacterium]
MLIEKYICDLLYEHDCVIIPSLGGFVTNYRKAGIDLKNQEFSPPARILAFNAELNNNDGLLINHIAKAENKSYDKVAEQVELFAKQTLFVINNDKKVELNGIGTLWTEEGRIQFVPEMKQNFLLDSYGLSSFNFPLLKDQKKPKTFSDIKSEKVQNTSKSTTTVNENTIKISKGTYKRTWLIGIPTAAALIAIVVFSFTRDNAFERKINQANFNPVAVNEEKTLEIESQEQENQKQENNKEILDEQTELLSTPETETDATIATDISETESIAEVTNSNNVETISEPEPLNTQVGLNTSNNRYYVIAGSFTYKDNAISCKDKLNQSGYPAQVHDTGKGMYRVSLKAFPAMQAAINELENLRSASGNRDLWVLYI